MNIDQVSWCHNVGQVSWLEKLIFDTATRVKRSKIGTEHLIIAFFLQGSFNSIYLGYCTFMKGVHLEGKYKTL